MTTRPAKVAVLDQLAADGHSLIFGNPGTVEQGLLDLVDGHPSLEYVLALQESVAVAIADGYARAGARCALVQLHSGVGLGNGVGMLYQAMRGHTPLVVVAGEAGVSYEALGAQMAVDLVAMAKPVTKYATRITDARSSLRVLRRAEAIAMTHPRGPVFVALPADVMDAMTDEPVVPAMPPSQTGAPDPESVATAVELLRGARRPLVLVGDRVSASGGAGGVRAVVQLAEHLGAPVWGVESSEVNFPMDHPLWRGHTGHMFGSVSAALVADADVVLVLGTYLFPEVFPSLGSPFAPKARIVHVDLDAGAIGKNFAVDVPIAADPAVTAAHLTRRLALPAHRHVRRSTTTTTEPDSLMGHFAAALRDRFGDELLVVDEALTASEDLVGQLRPARPGSYFATRGGSLGIGIPGAIGAKLARPEARVVGFTGDGGSMYTIQALWTAARYDVAATFVVCNNGRYGLLDDNLDHYRDEQGEPSRAYPTGFDLSEPAIGFSRLAQALGVDAVTVDKTDDITGAIEAVATADGPLLVDLHTA